MKKLIILSFFLLLAAVSNAKEKFKNNQTKKSVVRSLSSAQSVENYIRHCQYEFSEDAFKRGSNNNWIEQAPGINKGRTFRSSTRSFGTWLEVTITADGKPTLYEVNRKVTTEISYSSSCSQMMMQSQGLNFEVLNPDKLAKWLTDEKIKSLMATTRSGLVYVWSPEMVYSAKFFKYFRDISKKLNLNFIPVVDPRASMTSIDKAIKEFGIPPNAVKLNSVELYMRNLTVHYPTALVYRNNKIHELPIVGVMEPAELETQVNIRLDEILLAY